MPGPSRFGVGPNRFPELIFDDRPEVLIRNPIVHPVMKEYIALVEEKLGPHFAIFPVLSNMTEWEISDHMLAEYPWVADFLKRHMTKFEYSQAKHSFVFLEKVNVAVRQS